MRSATGRGSAEMNVFFNWQADMIQSELYVNSRLAQIRSTLPATATAMVWRLTFSAFPIIGVSLTSPTRDITALWEMARYDIKPRFLRIPGVARVDLVGGRTPEYHVIVDPLRLAGAQLSLAQVTDALINTNLVSPTGMHEENHTLYLTVVDGRVHDIAEIENLTVDDGERPSRPHEGFRARRTRPEPVFNVVTAEGVNAVLLNIRSQPDGSTLDIADGLKTVIAALQRELPPDMKLAFFYDQSLLVRASVRSVWEAILFGLILSVVHHLSLPQELGHDADRDRRHPGHGARHALAMRLAGLSFNLMTLGGIAAAIGLVIDDAIVVVEAIYAKIAAGLPRLEAIHTAIGEIFRPLVGSTLTPVVVFIPLAFLDGITGVFFRALALTMVVSLLTSLVLAMTLTPSLAAWLIRDPARDISGARPRRRRATKAASSCAASFASMKSACASALRHRWLTLIGCGVVLGAGMFLYGNLESDFLPAMDEGGFVIDYHAPYGTSLAETNRQLLQAEEILRATPRWKATRGAPARGSRWPLPNPTPAIFWSSSNPGASGDQDVIAELRAKFNAAVPGIEWEFPGILSDLIGDLIWSPQPIEVKLFSTDMEFLKKKAPRDRRATQQVKGVVDNFDGLVYRRPHPERASAHARLPSASA